MARRASGLGLLLLAAGVGEAAGVVPCTRIRGVPGARRWCGGGPGAGVIDGRAGFGSAPEARRLPRLVLRLRGGGSDTAPGRRGAEPASTGAGVGRGGGGLGCPRVFAAGGFVIGFGHSLVTDVVESYSPDRGGWRKEPALPLGISGCRAETLSGSIYVMGGQDARFVADDEPKAGGAAATDEHGEPETIDACVWPTLDTVFRLDSTRGEWLPAPPMLHRSRARRPASCFARRPPAHAAWARWITAGAHALVRRLPMAASTLLAALTARTLSTAWRASTRASPGRDFSPPSTR